jgi:hypothetical protein
MLYLYGASGTTYYYIHLNNDLTRGDDNRGKCIAGTAYATGLKDGAKVAAGRPVGFVGDSGDADGAHAHLHFEAAVVHSTNGSLTRKTTILSARVGQTVKVWTMPATASLKTERGDDLSLDAALVLLKTG